MVANNFISVITWSRRSRSGHWVDEDAIQNERKALLVFIVHEQLKSSFGKLFHWLFARTTFLPLACWVQFAFPIVGVDFLRDVKLIFRGRSILFIIIVTIIIVVTVIGYIRSNFTLLEKSACYACLFQSKWTSSLNLLCVLSFSLFLGCCRWFHRHYMANWSLPWAKM